MYRIIARWHGLLVLIGLILLVLSAPIFAGELDQRDVLRLEMALSDALNERAEKVDVGQPVRAAVYVDYPRVTWMAYLDEQVGGNPAVSGPLVLDDVCVRLRDQLLGLTREEAVRLDKSFDFRRNVCIEIYVPCRERDIYRQTRRYRGESEIPAEVFRSAEHLDLTIRLTRSHWRPRETITGTVVWRNNHDKGLRTFKVCLAPWAVEPLTGEEPWRTQAKYDACCLDSSFVTLEPGEHFELPIWIPTDPAGPDAATVFMVGAYRLNVRQVPEEYGARQVCSLAKFHVCPLSAADTSPRVLHFGVGGGRLIVLRENGRIEAYDIEGEDCVARAQVRDYSAGELQWKSQVVSGDGRLFALLRPPPEKGRAARVEVYAIDNNAAGGRPEPAYAFDLPAEVRGLGPIRLERVDPRTDCLIVASGEKVSTLELDTGRVARCVDYTSARPSSMGWLDMWLRQPDEAVPVDTPASLKERLAASDVEFGGMQYVGREGLYLEDRRSGRPVFIPYKDGEPLAWLADEDCAVLAEAGSSAIAAVVHADAFEWTKPGRTEVWSLKPPKLLWQVPDDRPRHLAFDEPSRVVCGISTGQRYWGYPYTGEFEVYDIQTGTLLKRFSVPVTSGEDRGPRGE